MVESGVLTAGAAIVGVGVAVLAIKLVTTYGAGYIPRIGEVRLSGMVLGWLAVLAVGSGPRVSRGSRAGDPRRRRFGADRSLRSGGRSTTDGPTARRLRRALVAAQFTLATPLIVAAVLVVVSLDRLSHVRVGIDTERVLTAAVSLSGPGYSQGRRPKGVLGSGARARGGAAGRRQWRRSPTAGRRATAVTATTSTWRITRHQPVRISPSARGWRCRRSSSSPSACRSNAAGCSMSSPCETTSSSWTARGPTDSSPARSAGPSVPARGAAPRVRGQRSSASSAT